MSYTNGPSDRNSERYDAPSDGPDGYRECDDFRADNCPMCGDPIPVDRVHSTYCSAICAIDAENDR